MNRHSFYWVALVLVVVALANLLLRAPIVPKNQPVFRQVPSQHVAFIHYQGAYEDMPLLYKAIGKEAKSKINGPAGAIYFPTKSGQKPMYEAYFPVKKDWVPQESAIQFKDIPSANVLVFYHVGPYASLSKTYEKTAQFFKDSKITVKAKSREVYVKGPGWIFKGNPKKYITEIQYEL